MLWPSDSGSVRRIVVLLLIAAIPAVAVALWHPRKPSWQKWGGDLREISLKQVASEDAVWIDARSEAAYQRGHIPGAVSLDEARWEESLPALVAAWRPGVRLVVYCDGADCGTSRSVARRLKREFGWQEIYVLKGGWRAFKEAHP